MKHLAKSLVLGLAAVTTFAACERGHRELADKKAPTESVEIAPNSGMMPGGVQVAGVMPDGGPKVVDGKAVFGKVCAACHQLTGLGVPGAFPPLDGSGYVLSNNTERTASILIYGLQGPIKVKGQDFNNIMAPLGSMSDEELAAALSYARSSWSNKAAPVEPSVFAEVRKKLGTRGMMQTSEIGDENS